MGLVNNDGNGGLPTINNNIFGSVRVKPGKNSDQTENQEITETGETGINKKKDDFSYTRSDDSQQMRLFDINWQKAGGPLGRSRELYAEQAQLVVGEPVTVVEATSTPRPRDVHGLSEVATVKGVKKLALGNGSYGWFKPSGRALNNPEIVVAMGVIKTSETRGATEATAHLAEREVAASLIARVVIPELAVGAELARDGDSRGVLLEHVPGRMASECCDESLQLESATYTSVEAHLADLQAFDYLIGNVDRHVENYMIADGRVRAIDNDLSFPTVAVTELGAPKAPGSKFSGLPAGYSPKFKQGLARITDKFLDERIEPLVGEAAFAQLKVRLASLREDVNRSRGEAKPTSPHLKGMVFS